MSQVHVKFLSNVQKDIYLFVSEVDSSLLPPVTPLPHHLNLIKEKDIYMRAALQLLDQKNLVPTTLDRGGATNNIHAHRHDPLSSSAKNPHHEENDMHDVIRLGYLKKGAKSGTMNIPGSGTHWKRKYVEVRHGLFCYDDYHGGTIYIGNSDLEELTRTDNFHRRCIKLNVETCRCRMLPAKDGHSPESRVFEIAIVDGAKRLWMASSVDECREWVKAINAAMVGGVYRSNASAPYSRTSRAGSGAFDHDTYQRISAKSDPTEYMHGYNIGNSAQDVSKIPLERNISEDPDHLHHHPFPMLSGKQSSNKHNDLWSSIDGAAAPYVADMSTFLQLQEAFLGCSNENSYRDILYSLFQDRTKLTIPVLFIKSKTKHSHFMLSAQDMLSTQNIRSKCSSQVWKDLQRDIIVVNGEQISGELGAESMLGALVRHLSDKAEALRALQDKKHPESHRAKHLGDSLHCISTSQKKSTSTFASTNSSNSSSSTNNNSNNNTNNNKSLTSVDFAISEAQIVECAKDLLVLCNRTQSGGDTYFCIEAFLSGDHMKEFCILTPYSAEAEPLEFKIDVVEVSQHLSPAVRRQHGIQNHGQDVHHSLMEISTSSLSRSGYNASVGGVSSNSNIVGVAISGGAGGGVGGGIDDSFIEEEGDIGLDDDSSGLKRQQQLQSQRQLQLLHHHMHSPLANSASSSSAISNQAQLQQTQLPSTPLPAPFNMRDIIDAAPSTGDFQHSPLTSSPSPVRTHPLSNNSSNSSLAKAAKNRSRKKSFTFEDVVLEGDLDHKKRNKSTKKIGKALLGTDDDNDEDDHADADTLSNDRDDEKEEYDEDEDDTDMYLSARSSHSKRTGLRLSGSGAMGFLGLKSDDFVNRYQAPSSPIVNPGANADGLYNNAIAGPPPPRRAQLDLKRELEKEGYLNSVWNSDGSSVRLQSSLFSQQQQQQLARYDQPLPPVPTKSISPFSSRPDSLTRSSGGVAIGYLELPHDADDSPVTAQPSQEATADNVPAHTTGDSGITVASSGENHSGPPSLSFSSLPPLPPATIVSQQTSSSGVTQVATSRPDDISVMSELTFDTFLRNQRHGHNNAQQLQSRIEINHQLSNHIDPALSLSGHINSISNHITPNAAQPSQVPSNVHLPPFHTQYHPNYNNTPNYPHMNTRPTSSGQTTSSGQVSPGTNSQRTSGHHDALTTTTCSSNGIDHSVPLSSNPYIPSVQHQQQQHQQHSHANQPQHASHNHIFSDGEEYGIMDDEGHDSNSNNQDNTSGAASASKKKSLLKRIGKKLRPFKMPHMTSTAAHGEHNSTLDTLRSPFSSGLATSRSRAPSDGGTPVPPTSTTHFQQFLQHLTPKHHNTNNHDHHHHHDSDKDTILSNGKHSHHKSHRYHHHSSSHNHHPHHPPLQSTSHSNSNSHQYGNLLQQAFHQSHTVQSSIDSTNNNNTTHSEPAVPQPLPPRYGLRIQVRAKCRYRVCGANPTGFVDVDSWATVTGIFHQSFLLVGDGRSQLGITDRLVTIEIDGCSPPHQLTSATPSMSLSSPFENTDQPSTGLSTPSHR